MLCRALLLPLATAAALATALTSPTAAQLSATASSYLGGEGDQDVWGAALLSDGRIVLAGSVNVRPGGEEVALAGAAADAPGALLLLSADGRAVERVARLPGVPLDLAVDADDRLYVAGGEAGLLAVDAEAGAVRWSATPGHVHRVDVGADGTVAALVPSDVGGVGGANDTPGAGTIHLYDAAGGAGARFGGHRNTLDLAVHAPSETVVLVGWRQARADGNPVQIAYLRGVGFDGETRWTGYDWSTENGADDFLNRPENNMADTRGYRVSVGRDGRLLAAFECAGGNHLFRYDPFDVSARVEIVGGDRYHEFFDTRSEHKTFFGVYDPASGAYRTGQQLTGRLSSGRGNTVRVREGAITTDASGQVYLAGAAAAGLPLSWTPEGTGDYTGGAYLVVMSPDLRERRFVTRMDPSGHAHAVDARSVDGELRVVLAGTTKRNGEGATQLWVDEAVQSESGGAEDGFFTAFTGGDAPPPAPGEDGGAPGGDDAGPTRDVDAGAPGAADGGGGCGCRAPGGGEDPDVGDMALVALLSLLLRRRRRA